MLSVHVANERNESYDAQSLDTYVFLGANHTKHSYADAYLGGWGASDAAAPGGRVQGAAKINIVKENFKCQPLQFSTIQSSRRKFSK